MDALDLPIRPRRLRRTSALRTVVRETHLRPEHLVYPLFVHAGSADEPIAAMPGQTRWSLAGLAAEAARARALGIRAVALFPKVDERLKTEDGRESWNPKGLVPEALAAVKRAAPDLLVITDVALDPYNSDGHDGIVTARGVVDNDASVAALCRQACMQAAAGADFVAPSDMMDGRIGAIRRALDAEGFTDTGILSYAAKYASAFYGPFRSALDSAPRVAGAKPIPKDKQTYQMDPANGREALREAAIDEGEGADILMVKPAGAYLDIISALHQSSLLPIAAYQVSGEYAMLVRAAEAGAVDLKAGVLESLLGIRRAGADLIFTYFAPQAAAWLCEE